MYTVNEMLFQSLTAASSTNNFHATEHHYLPQVEGQKMQVYAWSGCESNDKPESS
jgi:hypothetical protein